MASFPRLVLLTGGTGFLGSYLAQRILERSGMGLALLVRAESETSARLRAQDLFTAQFGPEAWDEYAPRIVAIPGDVGQPGLGLREPAALHLSERVEQIIHSAALTDFDKPYDEISRINVRGTEHVLEFAETCRRNGGLGSVAHISTIGVAGSYRGLFTEDQLFVGQEFHNSYERSKFEAETLCLEYRRRGLNVNILRPSIVIGDSRTGFAGTFKVIYQPLQIFSLGIYAEVPADDAAEYNLVPVDLAAEAIYRILESAPQNGTFHVTNSNVATGSLIFGAASRFFGYRDPRRIPLDRFDLTTLRGFRRKLLEPYLPYFNLAGLAYDNRRAMEILEPTGFSWPRITEELLTVIFQYCLDVGFITREDGFDLERC